MARFVATATTLRTLGAAAVLLLSACTSASPSAVPSPDSVTTLTGTAWVLDTVGGKPAVESTTSTARFADDGTVSGSGGCNRFSGPFSTNGNAIKVGDLASTMMACTDDIMAQESGFLAALGSASTFSVDAGILTLSDRDGAGLVTLTWQDQELKPSSWTLTGFNNGSGAVVGVLEDSTATLAFTEAGKVTGTGGCNRFMGGYQVEGSALKIMQLAGTKMACESPEGVMAQESAILKALSSTAEFVLEGDTLTLKDATDATAATLTRD